MVIGVELTTAIDHAKLVWRDRFKRRADRTYTGVDRMRA